MITKTLQQKKYYELESIFLGRFFRAEMSIKIATKNNFSQNEIEIFRRGQLKKKSCT